MLRPAFQNYHSAMGSSIWRFVPRCCGSSHRVFVMRADAPNFSFEKVAA
jgi:hypothetical protein